MRITLAILLLLGFGACAPDTDEPPPQALPPVRSAPTDTTTTARADLPTIRLVKTPACGCCTLWGERMREAGFLVAMEDVPDLRPIREEHGVPGELTACHTAFVDGYVVEGHVPAEAVMRLLDERPDVTGIAVAGMPIGSPGMEVEGAEPHRYDVIAFGPQGRSVYASY
ncbi:DUF411 domain-containing protein [soil metagenome]